MSSLIQTLLAGINCLSGVGPDKVSLIPDSGVSWPTKTVNANKAPKMRVFVGVQSSVHHKPWDNVWNFQKYLHWCWPGTEGYEKIHLQESLASIVNLFQLFLAALWNWTVDSSVFSKLKSDQVNCVDSRFLIFSWPTRPMGPTFHPLASPRNPPKHCPYIPHCPQTSPSRP